MNKVLEFLKSRTVSFYLRAAAAVLAFVPVIYTAMRLTDSACYIGCLVCALLAVAAQIALAFTEAKGWSDFIEIAAVVLTAAELSLFVAGGVLDAVDYIFEIDFWGDATQFGAILAYTVVLTVATALGIASSFMRKAYEKDAAR